MPRNRTRTVSLTGTFSPICIHRNLILSVVPAVETKPAGRFLPSEYKTEFSRAQHLQRGHSSKASCRQPKSTENRLPGTYCTPDERENEKHRENSSDKRINPYAQMLFSHHPHPCPHDLRQIKSICPSSIF